MNLEDFYESGILHLFPETSTCISQVCVSIVHFKFTRNFAQYIY